ncbi:GGT5 hydrolase, partial [Columbina picui]|nr:GGT5 hydrolase [Columbina picui]
IDMSTGKICCLVLLTLGVLAVVVVLVVILTQPNCGSQRYLHGAVAADTETCSVIGRYVHRPLGFSGHMLCLSWIQRDRQVHVLTTGVHRVSVLSPLLRVSSRTVEVINARETVPQRFPHDLLSGCTAGLPVGKDTAMRAVCAPGVRCTKLRVGEVRTLLTLSEVLFNCLHSSGMIFAKVRKNTSSLEFLPLICDDQGFLKHGDTFRWPALQKTLKAVAENGAAAFYEGQIGKALVEDIRKAGSTISLEDLQAYRADVSSALNITLNNHTTVFSPGPPMGGAVLLFILKILEVYKLHEASLATPKEKVETYHRIAEALKFGNMLKPHMSDPAFSKSQVTVRTVLSDKIAELARSRIDDRGDHPLNYYNLLESIYNHGYKSKGTSHISVLAADGSAVSATSTINYPFGSFVYSNQTGIILNNELADFCIANRNIEPGEHSHPQNKTQDQELDIQAIYNWAGTKPPSAMVPSILISKTGDMLVIGGAGGGWIISATAMAIINKLWLGYDLEHAISAPIMHTEGNNTLFEEHFSEEVRSSLLGRGHKEGEAIFAMNVVQGISKEGKCISAYSDKRKLGKSAGY